MLELPLPRHVGLRRESIRLPLSCVRRHQMHNPRQIDQRRGRSGLCEGKGRVYAGGELAEVWEALIPFALAVHCVHYVSEDVLRQITAHRQRINIIVLD
jgi:hypothetical protein